MGPPSTQSHGTTRQGDFARFKQGHGTTSALPFRGVVEVGPGVSIGF